MKILKITLILFLILTVSSLYAYKPKRTNNFSNYKDTSQEFGYAFNLSYLKYEKDFAPQLHIHYSKYLTNYFSMGVGYNAIYDKHYHNIFELDFSFRFYEKMIVSLKPGLSVFNKNGTYVWMYSMGVGTNYEFELTDFIHWGPIVQLSLLQNDVNFVGGIHMGFAF